MRYFLLLLGCLLALTGAAAADELWPNQQQPEASTFKEYQLSIGVATRFESNENAESKPMLSVEGLRFLTPAFALKLELGYIPETSFGNNGRASTLTTAIGFRLQGRGRIIAPYLEGDLGTWRLSGDRSGGTFSENMIAIGVTVGGAVKLADNNFLEFGIRPVLNDFGSYADPIFSPQPNTPPLPPDDNWSDLPMGYGYDSLNGMYNITHLFVRYRIGL